jgi:galactosylceramidase
MKNSALTRIIPSLVFAFFFSFQNHFSFAAPGGQTLTLDGAAEGKVFEGVGAVSGGGATSVLLKDYPEPQRSQILDVLFKPGFAASMQTLYVEVGSDGNSTQGTEPTHMRSRTDENYSRGYEWWLMTEAKKRNPALTLDACAWGCPGWVGGEEFWSQDMADYYAKWIKGLKANYGIDLDAIGGRNERGAVTSWMKLFRRTLDANGLQNVRTHGFDNPGNRVMWDWVPELNTDKELAAALSVASNHTLTMGPFPASVRETFARLGKPVWNTEEHVYNGEGRFYKDDYDCALGAVHLFNENFIRDGATKIVNWYLVGSTYGIEPYADQPPALIARSPWSGHYAIKPIIWSYAHYGQFTHIGWKYLASGCVALKAGGTMVALKSDEGDFSVIAETAAASAQQQVTIKIGGGLSTHPLCVWRTTRDAQFERQADITPGADGTLTATFEPGAIYSLSTTTGQQKGSFADVPAEKAFPFPYHENFKEYTEPKRWGYLPRYMADICGVFEITDRPDGMGKCLRQVVSQKAQSWAPEWMPYTVIGDSAWADYDVSADIFLPSGEWAGVMGRVNNTGNGWDGNPNGYYARLYADGGCALYVAGERYKGSRDKQLAIGEAKRWRWNRWHNLKLRFEGNKITVLLDNEAVIVAEDSQYGHGLAGLITAGEGNDRNTACFDNLLINKVGGGAVKPTGFDQTPIYGRR